MVHFPKILIPQHNILLICSSSCDFIKQLVAFQSQPNTEACPTHFPTLPLPTRTQGPNTQSCQASGQWATKLPIKHVFVANVVDAVCHQFFLTCSRARLQNRTSPEPPNSAAGTTHLHCYRFSGHIPCIPHSSATSPHRPLPTALTHHHHGFSQNRGHSTSG